MTIGDLIRMIPSRRSHAGFVVYTISALVAGALISLSFYRSYCTDRSLVRLYDPLNAGRGYVLVGRSVAGESQGQVDLMDREGSIVHSWLTPTEPARVLLDHNGDLLVQAASTSFDKADVLQVSTFGLVHRLNWQSKEIEVYAPTGSEYKQFQSNMSSSSAFLSNGNKLVVFPLLGRIEERTLGGEVVWQYDVAPAPSHRDVLFSASEQIPAGTTWAKYLPIQGSLFGGMCR